MVESMVQGMARAAYEAFVKDVRDLEPSWDELPESHRDRMLMAQRAAIEAMREPTDAMSDAYDDMDEWDTAPCFPTAKHAMNAMIDAALQELPS